VWIKIIIEIVIDREIDREKLLEMQIIRRRSAESIQKPIYSIHRKKCACLYTARNMQAKAISNKCQQSL
jgi:hypothetical protein